MQLSAVDAHKSKKISNKISMQGNYTGNNFLERDFVIANYGEHKCEYS